MIMQHKKVTYLYYQGIYLPETIDDYFTFIDKEFDFMNKRNARIHEYALENNL